MEQRKLRNCERNEYYRTPTCTVPSSISSAACTVCRRIEAEDPGVVGVVFRLVCSWSSSDRTREGVALSLCCYLRSPSQYWRYFDFYRYNFIGLYPPSHLPGTSLPMVTVRTTPPICRVLVFPGRSLLNQSNPRTRNFSSTDSNHLYPTPQILSHLTNLFFACL